MTIKASHLFVLLAFTACTYKPPAGRGMAPSSVKANLEHPRGVRTRAAPRIQGAKHIRLGYQKSGPHFPWKPFE